MKIALAVEERTNCLKRKVGAVLVQNGRVISTGYNGTPTGTTNCREGGCDRCRHPEKYPSGKGYDLCICVHAEQNALVSAARFGIPVDGASLFVTVQPCFTCTKELLQANIGRVYFLREMKPADDLTDQYDMLIQAFRGGVHRLRKQDWPEGADLKGVFPIPRSRPRLASVARAKRRRPTRSPS